MMLWKRKLQEVLSADGRWGQHVHTDVHCDPGPALDLKGRAKGRSHAPEKQKLSNSCVWSFPAFLSKE